MKTTKEIKNIIAKSAYSVEDLRAELRRITRSGNNIEFDTNDGETSVLDEILPFDNYLSKFNAEGIYGNQGCCDDLKAELLRNWEELDKSQIVDALSDIRTTLVEQLNSEDTLQEFDKLVNQVEAEGMNNDIYEHLTELTHDSDNNFAYEFNIAAEQYASEISSILDKVESDNE